MNSCTSTCSAASADLASQPKQPDSAQFAFANLTPTGRETCGIGGQTCQSSETSTTPTPSVELWPTTNTCDATRGSAETDEDKLNRGANPGTSLIDSVNEHSSSPPGRRASLPLPPVSEREVVMTVGSGRRLSGWLSDCGQTGACLKTLLESHRWRNPLRSLAWTLKGYGMSPDEPSVKSSRQSSLWDMNSLQTTKDVLGFRLCRLRVLERSTAETGCGSSPDAEMWLTPSCPRPHDNENTSGADFPSQNQNSINRQALNHASLTWSRWEFQSLTKDSQEHACQTGPTPSSNADKTASGGQLNPDFVCFLMGYPEGHLNYADSEIQSARKSRSKSSKQ